MLPSDRDFCSTAKLLLDQHGEDATIHTAQRADEMLAEWHLERRTVCTWRS